MSGVKNDTKNTSSTMGLTSDPNAESKSQKEPVDDTVETSSFKFYSELAQKLGQLPDAGLAPGHDFVRLFLNALLFKEYKLLRVYDLHCSTVADVAILAQQRSHIEPAVTIMAIANSVTNDKRFADFYSKLEEALKSTQDPEKDVVGGAAFNTLKGITQERIYGHLVGLDMFARSLADCLSTHMTDTSNTIL